MNIKLTTILLSTILAASCGRDSVAAKASDVLTFDAELNEENVASALSALQTNPSIKTIRIRSGGGFPIPAGRLAEAIRQKGLSVEVQDVCLSACMSLVFPAGKTRRVSDGAVLGFHYADSYDVAVLQPIFGSESVKLQLVTDTLSRRTLRG